MKAKRNKPSPTCQDQLGVVTDAWEGSPSTIQQWTIQAQLLQRGFHKLLFNCQLFNPISGHYDQVSYNYVEVCGFKLQRLVTIAAALVLSGQAHPDCLYPFHFRLVGFKGIKTPYIYSGWYMTT